MSAEVFAHDTFLTAAKKHFVLVSLDFPQGEEARARVPDAARNNELKEKYGIRGFPTVLLMSAAGDVYCRTGYRPGGAEPYATFIVDNKSQYADAISLAKQFAEAAEDARAPIAEKAVALMAAMDGGNAGVAKLAEAVKAALALDPNNEKGLKAKALGALMSAGLGDDGIRDEALAIDPKNEFGLREKVVAAKFFTVRSEEQAKACIAALKELDAMGTIKDRELAFELYARVAVWSHKGLKDAETAKTYARKAKEIGTENAQLLALFDEILGS